MRRLPWSLSWFALTGISFLLQLFPLTGVFLMLLAAPLWSILTVNVGFVSLAVEAAAYVHRIGRTGRAGKAGVAISFCDETEGGLLRDIERLTGTPLAPDLSHRWHDHDVIPDRNATGAMRPAGQGKGRGGRRRR